MAENFFNSLSPETLRLVEKLLAEPLRDGAALRAEVIEYGRKIREVGDSDAYVDVELATAIEASCLGLLDHLRATTAESQHRFIQLACRYFVEEEDEDGDLTSVIGFDDDAEVVNLVADQLGYHDLKVSGLPGLRKPR